VEGGGLGNNGSGDSDATGGRSTSDTGGVGPIRDIGSGGVNSGITRRR